MLRDALQVNRCSQLYDYQIIYDRKIADACYLDFPVRNLQSNQMQFLSLYNRQLKAGSTIIHCKDRLSQTYIKDRYQITEVVLQSDTVVGLQDFKLKKMGSYDKRLFQKAPPHLEPYAMSTRAWKWEGAHWFWKGIGFHS